MSLGWRQRRSDGWHACPLVQALRWQLWQLWLRLAQPAKQSQLHAATWMKAVQQAGAAVVLSVVFAWQCVIPPRLWLEWRHHQQSLMPLLVLLFLSSLLLSLLL